MRFILVSADDPNLRRPLEIPDEIVKNIRDEPPKKRQKPISTDNPNLCRPLEIPDEIVKNIEEEPPKKLHRPLEIPDKIVKNIEEPPKKRQKPIKKELPPKPTKSIQKSRVYG